MSELYPHFANTLWKFRMSNLKIVWKVALAFGSVLAVTLALGLVTVHGLSGVTASVSDLRDNRLPASMSLSEMARGAERFRTNQALMLLAGNQHEVAAARDAGKMARETFERGWASYELTITPPDELPLAAAVKDAWAAYMRNSVRLDEIMDSFDRVGAGDFFAKDLSGAASCLQKAIEDDLEFQRRQATLAGDAGQATARQAYVSTYGFLAVSGLLCVVIGWLMMRWIARPIVATTRTMRRLAENDLTADVQGTTRGDELGEMARAVQVFKDNALRGHAVEAEADAARRGADAERARGEAQRAEAARLQAEVVEDIAEGLDRLSRGDLVSRLDRSFAPEYEKLRANFNGAMAKLQDTLKVVAQNGGAIRSGTGEISTAADDLSRRTEQQAASLEETAAALDEITATVRKTADGAKHANAAVLKAKAGAEDSGRIVREAVDAMGGIEKSSAQITQIIGVIDEIAFQTNLLALNAGVEAARAGDAGRGFAVVASEVRALAQRSAEAAKEIKGLIAASRGQVERGVDLVGRTGAALDGIVAQVGEIAVSVAEIAASAQEQASGLDQVNTAINQMDQVTQQNAAMVEESTAASRTLAAETDELMRLIGHFQVGDQAGTRRTAAAPGRAAAPRPVRPAAPSRPVAALKTTGRGGAARQPEAAAWEDF